MAGTVPSFENFLLALQRWAWDGSKYARYRTYLDDVTHVRQLLAAVDAGLVVSSAGVAAAAELGLMPTVGAEHFLTQPGFDDDARFTPTRFAFVFEFHKERRPHDMSVMAAANAQVERMLLAGRIPPNADYLGAYHDQVNALVLGGGDWRAWVPLVAHFEVVRQVMVNRAAASRDHTGSNGDETYAMMGHEAQLVLDGADRFRDDVFRDYWLRSILSEAEWLEARELASPMLRELYADVWAAGYAGYQRRLAASAG